MKTSHLIFHTTPPAAHPHPHPPLLCRPALQRNPTVSDLGAFLFCLFSQCNFLLPLELSNEYQLPILGEDTLPVLRTSLLPNGYVTHVKRPTLLWPWALGISSLQISGSNVIHPKQSYLQLHPVVSPTAKRRSKGCLG